MNYLQDFVSNTTVPNVKNKDAVSIFEWLLSYMESMFEFSSSHCLSG